MQPPQNKIENKIWKHVCQDYKIDSVMVQDRFRKPKVVKAMCKLTGKYVAIRLVSNIFGSERNCRNMLREM